jgi:hypothetical protein
MIPGGSCLLPASPTTRPYLTNQTYRENAGALGPALSS